MRRAAGLCLALILAVALAYVSRFWVVERWGREGLFGVGEVRAGGDLWRGWMRGIGLGAFDLILWAVAGFALLTVVQKIWDRLTGH